MQSLIGDEVAVVPAEVCGDVVAAWDEQGIGAGVQGVGVVKVVPRQVTPILGHLQKWTIIIKIMMPRVAYTINCAVTQRLLLTSTYDLKLIAICS